jgi:hypothetical protein
MLTLQSPEREKSVVIQIHSVPWNSVPTKKEAQNIFDKMRDITDDTEWKNIMEEASKGNFRPGFRCQPNTTKDMEAGGVRLCYCVKTRSRYVVLPMNDPVKALLKCQKFMREMDGVRTNNEKTQQREETSGNTDVPWARIKKSEVLRNFHLTRYGNKLAQHRDMSNIERSYLIYSLMMMTNNPNFKHDRIIFSERNIAEIKGLKWNSSGKQLIWEFCAKEPLRSIMLEDTGPSGIKYRKNWENYLKQQDKTFYVPQLSQFSPSISDPSSNDQ